MSFHTAIITERGLYVCGKNGYGELGLGHKINRDNWTKIRKLPGNFPQNVICGPNCSFLVTEKGIFACGYNRMRQLGITINGDVASEYTIVNKIPIFIKNQWKFLQFPTPFFPFGFNPFPLLRPHSSAAMGNESSSHLKKSKHSGSDSNVIPS